MKRYSCHIIPFLFLALIVSGSSDAQDTYQIENLSFNSRISDDFAPMFFEDGIIFCSNRKSKVLTNYTTVNNEPLLDFYFVQQEDSAEWGKAKTWSEELLSVFNEGPACFSKDRRTIYFTRNITADKKSRKDITGDNNYGIFTASYNGSTWGDIKAFRHNNPDYKTGHPSLSEDGKQLFFASDIPGGFGGSDLYVCILTNGEWSDPVNLGSSVNSSSSEIYPFYHSSGRLYFSSDRTGSAGGLDIYFTQEINGEWVTPTRLPAPFNSGSDDFAFIADELIETGFFTSNRERNDDIYSFRTMVPKYAGCDTLQENNYCYLFYETGAYDLDTVPFSYEWDMGDGTKIRSVEADYCFDGPGSYMVKLNVVDKLTGDIQFNQASYLIEIENIEQAYINSVDTGYVGDNIRFDGLQTNLPDLTVGEYLWNFDDGNIGTGAEVRNRFTYPGIYQVQLVVKSVPDGDGSVREACVTKQLVVIEKPPGR